MIEHSKLEILVAQRQHHFEFKNRHDRVVASKRHKSIVLSQQYLYRQQAIAGTSVAPLRQHPSLKVDFKRSTTVLPFYNTSLTITLTGPVDDVSVPRLPRSL
jgi:hypothetical protein